MKRFYLLLLTFALTALPCVLFVTCSKEQSTVSGDLSANGLSSAKVTANATIVGEDARQCVCCGGYFLSIDNNKPIAGQYFLTYEFPGGYVPLKYPVKVYIEWDKDPKACINDKIIVKRIIPVASGS